MMKMLQMMKMMKIKTKKETKTTIFDLPEELWPMIFDGLSYTDIIAFSKTNSNTYRLVTENVRYTKPKLITKTMFFHSRHDFNEIVKRSLITKQLISLLINVEIRFSSPGVSALGGVYTLYLPHMSVTDDSAFGKRDYTFYLPHTSITDVSAFRKRDYTIYLSHTSATDVSTFGKRDYIFYSPSCENITPKFK